MAEQLPEGTDSIIEDSAVNDARVEDMIAEDLGHGAASRASADNGGTGESAGAKSGGSWFDKIDEFKTQGIDSARAYAVSGKDRATGALDDLIKTVMDTAGQIDAKVGTSYGDYARRAADGLGSFNDALKGRDVDDLFAEARAMVAKAPAVAVGTAAALGFVIARLARAGVAEAEKAAAPGKPDAAA